MAVEEDYPDVFDIKERLMRVKVYHRSMVLASETHRSSAMQLKFSGFHTRSKVNDIDSMKLSRKMGIKQYDTTKMARSSIKKILANPKKFQESRWKADKEKRSVKPSIPLNHRNSGIETDDVAESGPKKALDSSKTTKHCTTKPIHKGNQILKSQRSRKKLLRKNILTKKQISCQTRILSLKGKKTKEEAFSRAQREEKSSKMLKRRIADFNKALGINQVSQKHHSEQINILLNSTRSMSLSSEQDIQSVVSILDKKQKTASRNENLMREEKLEKHDILSELEAFRKNTQEALNMLNVSSATVELENTEQNTVNNHEGISMVSNLE